MSGLGFIPDRFFYQATTAMDSSKALNRQQLVQQMATRVDGLTQKLSAAALQAALDTIVEALSSGQPVHLSGFGTFSLRHRQARTNLHPRTGQPVAVPAARVAVFTPSAQLRKRLQLQPSAEEQPR
jgi:nucleoid DNA-binding protein